MFNIFRQIENKKIRVRFEDIDSGTKSDSYIVTNIGYDPNPNGIPDGAVTISLANSFGVDVEFLTLDTATNVHGTTVFNNIQIIFEEIVVENSPKFDGRFFVKIYNNETTRTEIGTNVDINTKYKRISSRPIYYLSDNCVDLHSYSAGAPFPGSQDPFATPVNSPTGGGSSSPTNWHSQGIPLPNGFNFDDEMFINGSNHQRVFFYKYNAFFRGDITYSIQDRGQVSSSGFEDVWYIDGNTPHRVITGG